MRLRDFKEVSELTWIIFHFLAHYDSLTGSTNYFGVIFTFSQVAFEKKWKTQTLNVQDEENSQYIISFPQQI